MEQINRYIYQVKKHLPEAQREEVGKELSANLLDRVGENPSEEEVMEALMELGHPEKLAQEYTSVKNYLIGPAYFEKYLEVLKLVTSIVVIVLVVVQMLALFLGTSGVGSGLGDIGAWIGRTISTVVGAALQAAFWVTLIFALLERSSAEGVLETNSSKPWSPKDLPPVPERGAVKISKVEAALTLVFTVFIMVLIYQGAEWLGVIYKESGGELVRIPVFNAEQFQRYIPYFWLFAGANLIFVFWQLLKEYWTVPMALVNLVIELAFVVLVLVMVRDPGILHPDLTRNLAEVFTVDPETVSGWLRQGTVIGIVALLFFSLLDSVSVLYKMWKKA